VPTKGQTQSGQSDRTGSPRTRAERHLYRTIVLVLPLVSAWFVWQTLQLPVSAVSKHIGPRTVPMVAGVGMLVTSTIWAAAVLFKRHSENQATERGAESDELSSVVAGNKPLGSVDPDEFVGSWRDLGVSALGVAGYVIGFAWIGHYAGALMAIPLVIYFDENKGAQRLKACLLKVGCVILFIIALDVLFARLLGIPLPGSLFN